MSSEPKMCVNCEEDIQYEDSPLCRVCLNRLNQAQRKILALTNILHFVQSEISKKELLAEIGNECHVELIITKYSPELRVMDKDVL